MFCLTCLEVITAWLGVDSISGDHLIQPPCSKQVAQGPVQQAFECLKRWRCHSLHGQPVPGLTHLTEKKRKKKKVLCSDGIPCISICTHHLLSFRLTPLRRVWFCLHYSFRSGMNLPIHLFSLHFICLSMRMLRETASKALLMSR